MGSSGARLPRRKMTWPSLAFGLLALLLLMVACNGGGDTPPDSSSPGLETMPPDRDSWAGTVSAPGFPAGMAWFNVAAPLSLDDLQGKVVLLDFWTLGCINCQHIIPDLERLKAEYADSLVVIGVHSGKYERERDDESILDAIQKYGVAHPVVNDADFAVWEAYGVNAWPTTVLIDPAGKLVGKHAGEGVYEVLQPVVASLVDEFDGAIDTTPVPLVPASQASAATVLSYPADVAVDADAGRLYIADSGNNRVLIATLDGVLVDAIGTGEGGFADGAFGEAAFREPQGIGLSADGATLFVADTRNHAVRAVDLAAGMVTTIAGTGRQLDRLPGLNAPARDTAMASPWDVVAVGPTLFVAMAGVHQLWSIDLPAGTVSVFAGTSREALLDGDRLSMAAAAQPSGITAGAGWVSWADAEASAIRRVPVEGQGDVETVVGTGLFDFGDVDGVADDVRLQHAQGLVAVEHLLYVADTYNHRLKVVDPAARSSVTFAGDGVAGWKDGTAEEARFNEPGGLAAADGVLWVADTNNHLIRRVDLETGDVSTVRLSNLAAVMGSQDARALVVELPAASAAPGGSTLRIRVVAPDGMKLNRSAPSVLALSSDNPSVAAIGEEEVRFDSSDAAFEAPIPLILEPGGAVLRLRGEVYYCREGEEALCFIQPLDVSLALTVTPSSTAGEVEATIVLPAVVP